MPRIAAINPNMSLPIIMKGKFMLFHHNIRLVILRVVNGTEIEKSRESSQLNDTATFLCIEGVCVPFVKCHPRFKIHMHLREMLLVLDMMKEGLG